MEKPIKTKDIGRVGSHFWIREAWAFQVQHNLSAKVHLIERLRHTHRVGERGMEGGAEAGDIEYRIGY